MISVTWPQMSPNWCDGSLIEKCTAVGRVRVCHVNQNVALSLAEEPKKRAPKKPKADGEPKPKKPRAPKKKKISDDDTDDEMMPKKKTKKAPAKKGVSTCSLWSNYTIIKCSG